MWVRNQSKDCLIDTNEFEVGRDATIWGCSHLRTNGYKLLGQYETDERALKILDEIQKQLMENSCYFEINEQHRQSSGCSNMIKQEHVYKMPEK